MAEAKQADKDNSERWFLKLQDGKIYGPSDLQSLHAWAEEGRIGPGCQLSTDKRAWVDAETIPNLHLEWMVQTPDNSWYGPFNLRAATELMENGTLPAKSRIARKSEIETSLLTKSDKGRKADARRESSQGKPPLEPPIRADRAEADTQHGTPERITRKAEASKAEDDASATGLLKTPRASAARKKVGEEALKHAMELEEQNLQLVLRIQELEGLQGALDDERRRLSEANKQLKDLPALTEELHATRDRADRLLEQIDASKERAKACDEAAARAQQEQIEKTRDLERQVSELTGKLAAATSLLERARSDLVDERAEHARARAEAELREKTLSLQTEELAETAQAEGSDEARETLALEETLRSMTAAAEETERQLDALERDIEERQNAVAELERQFAADRKKKNDLSKVDQFTQKIPARRKEIETALQALKTRPPVELSEAERERMAAFESGLKKIDEDMAKVEMIRSNLARWPDLDVGAMNRQLEQHQSAITSADERVGQLKATQHKQKRDLGQVKRELAEARKRAPAPSSRKTSIARAKVVRLDTELAETRKAASEEQTAAQQQIAAINDQLLKARSENDALARLVAENEQKLARAEAAAEEARTRIVKVEERAAQMIDSALAEQAEAERRRTSGIEATHAAALKRVADLEAALAETGTQAEQSIAEAMDREQKLTQRMEQATAQIEAARNDAQLARVESEKAKQEIAAFKERAAEQGAAASDRIAKLERTLAHNQEAFSEQRELLEEAKLLIQQKDRELAEGQRLYNAVQDEADKREEDLQLSMLEIQQKHMKLSRELQAITQQTNAERSQLQKRVSELEREHGALVEEQRIRKLREQELANQRRETDTLKSQIEQAATRHKALEADIGTLRATADDLRVRLAQRDVEAADAVDRARQAAENLERERALLKETVEKATQDVEQRRILLIDKQQRGAQLGAELQVEHDAETRRIEQITQELEQKGLETVQTRKQIEDLEALVQKKEQVLQQQRKLHEDELARRLAKEKILQDRIDQLQNERRTSSKRPDESQGDLFQQRRSTPSARAGRQTPGRQAAATEAATGARETETRQPLTPAAIETQAQRELEALLRRRQAGAVSNPTRSATEKT